MTHAVLRRVAVVVLVVATGCFVDPGASSTGNSGTEDPGTSSGGAATSAAPTSDDGESSAPTGDGSATGSSSGEGSETGGGTCGDGVLDVGEQCDDGNLADGDGCSAACQTTGGCGDGVVQSEEACDLGSGNANDGSCTASCTKAICGDGLVWGGVEGCDDGNQNNDDGCSNACQTGGCGNGSIDDGEQCDDGNIDNHDDCKNDCSPSFCGDGVMQTQGTHSEQCDDGNQRDGDGCSSQCTAEQMAMCGNGVVERGEACDDANPKAGDTCDQCQRTGYYVFVTSTKYTGDLGGLTGADSECNGLAQTAQLPGNYRAWLGDDAQAATDRLHHSPHPYIRTDLVLVATDWEQLTSAMLTAPISHTEEALPAGEMPDLACEGLAAVWTGTQPNGLNVPQQCMNWTLADDDTIGVYGVNTSTDLEWTAACQAACSTQARLYCVEQPP